MTLLADFNKDSLANHNDPIVGLWPDFRMAYFNPAWFVFARDNDGEPVITRDWTLGRSIMDAVPDTLKGFYRRAWRTCLSTGIAWSHDYECSSAGLYRLFHQRVYPLGRGEGLLVVHSQRQESPHAAKDRPESDFASSHYVDRNGFVHQCANCRRIENLTKRPNRWDWVPTLVETPHAQVSHSICPICLDFYHPNP